MPPRRIVVLTLALALPTLWNGALEVRTYTASEVGFLACSHLILGSEEAILVDAQFTRSEAYDVVRMIHSTERSLRSIFVTHGQPEHYLGLEVLTESFPGVRVLARPATIDAMERNFAEAISRWRPIYMDDLPERLVLPEAFTDAVLALEDAEILVVDLGDDAPTPLYIPSERTLITSDMVLDKVHLWLDGVEPADWLRHLATLRELGPIDRVCPGHGTPAGTRLLDESETYLATLERALHGDPERVVATMGKSFPDHQLPVLLERSLKALRGRRGR